MTASWACLLYHEIPDRASGGATEGYFSVERSRFGAHLDLLTQTGLRGVALESMLDGSEPRSVAITFDDGHASHYTAALPELVSRGMTATFFVTTSWVGRPGYVSWAQLRQMAELGMSVQSHTHTHPFLSELDLAGVRYELQESQARLGAELGRAGHSLALPNGDLPQRPYRHVFHEMGYQCIATSRWGPNRLLGGGPPKFIRRYTVRRSTGLRRLAAMATASSSAWAPEGLRLSGLGVVRASLGPSRYATIRRRILGAFERGLPQ